MREEGRANIHPNLGLVCESLRRHLFDAAMGMGTMGPDGRDVSARRERSTSPISVHALHEGRFDPSELGEEIPGTGGGEGGDAQPLAHR